jgi:ABC-type amino acid transport substrate-binding protein
MLMGEPFTNEFYGIVSRNENADLMQEINRILREMKTDGRLETIKKRWI